MTLFLGLFLALPFTAVMITLITALLIDLRKYR